MSERIQAALAVLEGIETEVLEHIAALPESQRYGALSDIAKVQHIKAKDERETRHDRA